MRTLQTLPHYASEPSLGNRVGEDLLGMIFPANDQNANWFIVMSYISSDDAKNWNADELIANIKEGTEETNKERKTRGRPIASRCGIHWRPLRALPAGAGETENLARRKVQLKYLSLS